MYASQANLSCQHNDNNHVLHEKKISYVSNENIYWLDPYRPIAAATADVVLAVEKDARRLAVANGTCLSFCTF